MNTDTEKPLVNRVANSGLITINLEDFFPKAEIASFDLKQYLFMELILKEKDFREAVQQHDWSQYQGKVLLVFCSADAIIPMWAYMLVAASAAPYAADVFQGDAEAYYKTAFAKALDTLEPAEYDQNALWSKVAVTNLCLRQPTSKLPAACSPMPRALCMESLARRCRFLKDQGSSFD